MMASQSGNNDAGSSGQGISSELRARDLPSKRLLGKGLSSIVYETEWNGERCARKDFIGVPNGAFQKESAILVGLKDHVNVVKTHARTLDKMSCSLVLEYMEENLLDLSQKRKESQRGASVSVSGSRCEENPSYPFELAETLAILSQIARGMEFLHEQNIPHGDLKTKNILVSHMHDGHKNVLSVKVADFGLVRTKSKSMSFVSRQARKLDVVQWKAPEVLERLLSEDNDVTTSESDSNSETERTGSLGVSDRLGADVYSFAVTCSQILTGEGPYPNGNWKELGPKIVSGELRPNLPAACPGLLKYLLESCWTKSLTRRPTFSFIRELLDFCLLDPETLNGTGLSWPRWQSEQDIGLRRHIEDNILQLFKNRKPHVTPEWQQKLPDFVKRLEEALYKDAASKDEYADLKTLEQRLQSVAWRMVPHQPSYSVPGHLSLKEVREKNKFSDYLPTLAEKPMPVIQPKRLPNYKKLSIEIRPPKFRRKLWFGSYEPDDVDRAVDAINYYMGSNQPYHYSDSPLIFAEIPLKGIQFKDLQPSCDQFIQVGEGNTKTELDYKYFVRQVKEAIHSVIGGRKKSVSFGSKHPLSPPPRETSPSPSHGNTSSTTEGQDSLTSLPSSKISPSGKDWLYDSMTPLRGQQWIWEREQERFDRLASEQDNNELLECEQSFTDCSDSEKDWLSESSMTHSEQLEADLDFWIPLILSPIPAEKEKFQESLESF